MKLINIYETVGASELPRSIFTKRETEVLGLLVRGFSNQQIADSIGVSYYTATTHLKNIYKKLGVHKRTEAMAKVLLGKLTSNNLYPARNRYFHRHPENLERVKPLTN